MAESFTVLPVRLAAHGATACTLDQRLAQAGPAFGVPTRLLA